MTRNNDYCSNLKWNTNQVEQDQTKEPFVRWRGLVSEALDVDYMTVIGTHPGVGNLSISIDNTVYTCPRSWVTDEEINAGPQTSMDNPMIKLLQRVFTTAEGPSQQQT